MTTATPRASINSGAWQYGGITESSPAVPLAVSDTVDLSRDATIGVIAETYEIYSYPPTFPVPAGWTDVSGIFTFYGATPTQFTLTLWGKYLVRLKLTTSDGIVSSTALGMSIISPNGLEDTALLEEDQFGGWAAVMQRNWRVIEAGI